MATNFPTGLDSFTNPTPTDYLNSPSHSGQHANANDALLAIQTKLGITGSTDPDSVEYKLNGLTKHTFVLSNYTTFKLALDAVEDAGGGELILDGGTWEFSELDRDIPSNIIMRCTMATTIKAPDGIGSDPSLFDMTFKDNIAILDPLHILTLDGNRDARAEHDSEFGMNIMARGVANLVVEVGLCQNAHGDGLYIGSAHSNGVDWCSNVFIPFIDCYNSYRNGLTINSAKNLHLVTGIFRGSNGIGENGVDFEPDYDYQKVENVYLENILAYDNGACGFQESVNERNYGQAGSLRVGHIEAYGNGASGVNLRTAYYGWVHIEIESILTHDNDQNGLYLLGAEQNCHIGTVWAFNNGQDEVANAVFDSGVVFDHTGGTLDADFCVIDTIIAYDNQATKTQQYAFYIDGNCTSSSVYIGKILDFGNVKSIDNADVQLVIGNNGWIPIGGAWTYLSATEITVPAGGNHIFNAGDKIKIYNESWKYFNVVSCTDTVLTISGGTTYTLTNAAISGQRYSHQFSPFGYPAAGL